MNWTVDQVRAFFRAHWTVRKYKPVAMPSEHLDVILFAAQRAPTDATAQMYSFIRLTDVDLKSKVAALSANPHIATASESFLVCADVHRLEKILAARDLQMAHIPRISVHFAIGDAVMAGENMLLAAEMLGYRGCWIGGVLNALTEISDLVELPHGVFPFAALTIGVPDEEPKHRPRIPRTQVIHENRYVTPHQKELIQGINDMASITARGDWAATLGGYFAKGGTMEAREKTLEEFLHQRLGRGSD